MTADVVVVGAGVMGAWIALTARREGWQTTLLDAFGAGHPRATSGDVTRIIRAAHGDDPFYSRWAREALPAWNALAAPAMASSTGRSSGATSSGG